jgi:HPt (histidine-containing phosphotransfer) domain-containing protein
VPDIIHEDVINLDVDKINFDDKEAMKELIIQLLSTIQELLQKNKREQIAELDLYHDR